MTPPTEFSNLKPPVVGQVIADRFEVRGYVGRGGMSLVYRVWDRTEETAAALKVLRPELAGYDRIRHRLAAEAVTMVMLDHPHIARVRDMGVDPATEVCYIATDWAPGGSASEHVKRLGPLPVATVARWGVEVCCALSVAHARGVVHRDVKPGNVLVGEQGQALLADFGIALVPDADAETDVNAVLGSLSYMAPEQRLSPASVGPAADLYGLGATLFNLVTKKNPVDLFVADPADPRWEPVSEPLRDVLIRATRHRVADRYPDARAMGRALAPLAPEDLWLFEPWLAEWLAH